MLNQDRHKVAMFRLLTDIFRDPFLAAALGFKGGTACYFFHSLPRFSVDLDFDIISKAENVDAEVYGRIEKLILATGLEIKDKELKRNTVFFVASYAMDDHNIKIEASRRDYPNAYEFKDFYGLTVRVLSRADIFAHKLVAATDRKNPASRDFFDIYFFFKEAWPIHEEIITLRTGKTLKEYLPYLKEYIEKHVSANRVLHGLGELIDEKQKAWVKAHLKAELQRIISFHLPQIPPK